MRIAAAAVMVLTVGLSTLASGCGHPPPVRPWQREHLSRRAMQFDDGMETKYKQHWFAAREGADGGFGTVGGGCGCN